MVPNQQQAEGAWMIFVIIHRFVVRGTEAHKRNSALESFPESFENIPWRQVYKATAGAQSASYPITDWDAGELSFGGAGTFWCFTELPRLGENISRKTQNGQTWTSKTGRIRNKKGFPDEIRVDRLVISTNDFDMLELTLNQEKPVVALCKIWRKGNSAAAPPQTTKPNVFSPGTSTSHQVEDLYIHEEATDMRIDQTQSQGQLEDNVHQHMSGYKVAPNSANPEGQLDGITQLHIGGYTVHPNYIEGLLNSSGPEGQLDGFAQQHMGGCVVPPNSIQGLPNFSEPEGKFDSNAQHHMRRCIVDPVSSEALPYYGQLDDNAQQDMSGHMMPPNSVGIANSVGPGGFNQSTGQDHDSIYQCAVSYLYKEKGSFKDVALHRKEEARELASMAQILASAMAHVLNFLGINKDSEECNRQASTSDNTQPMETSSYPAACAPGPETATQGEAEARVTQECSIHDNCSDLEAGWEFLNLDEENQTDFCLDQAM